MVETYKYNIEITGEFDTDESITQEQYLATMHELMNHILVNSTGEIKADGYCTSFKITQSKINIR